MDLTLMVASINWSRYGAMTWSIRSFQFHTQRNPIILYIRYHLFISYYRGNKKVFSWSPNAKTVKRSSVRLNQIASDRT